MNSGLPRKTKMKPSAGRRSQRCGLALASASALASTNPAASASTPKYRFQIIPEPISVTCWHRVKSLRGSSRSPIPMERSP